MRIGAVCVVWLGLTAAVGLGLGREAHAAEGELPPLPAAPRVELAKPDADSLRELDERLAALSSNDAATRDAAARELLEVDARLVPALAFRLEKIADSADKQAMKRLFLEIRKESRDVSRTETDADNASSKSSSDYLAMLVTHARPDSAAYRDLIAVVGISRMLSQIGTVGAVRTLLGVYVRFGEFLRIHVQRELARLGDEAVPALIEARKHPAEKIARWSGRQLDALGRAAPSLAVQIQDYQVLADVLTAYGRVRDPDATRIIVSFASSERAIVREAARQAIGLFGEVAMWQLKDAYESLVGKKPPRDWSWERTARELFAEFDRARSAQVTRAFEAGQAARTKGDLIAMRKAYDEVVVRNPKFERRSELATGYFAYAERYFDEQPAEVEIALLRAQRYSDDPKDKSRAQSGLMTLQASRALKRGVADVTLLNRAIELDSNNQRAVTMLTELRRGKADRQSQRSRTFAAASVILGALAAIVVLLRRRTGAAAATDLPVTPAKAAAAPAPSPDVPTPSPDIPAPSPDVPAPSPDVPAPGPDLQVPSPELAASSTDLAPPTSTPEPMLTVSAATPSVPSASDAPVDSGKAAPPSEPKSD